MVSLRWTCIGVGHGSCSVMHALVGQDLCLSLSVFCVCGRLSGVATNLGRGKYGESGNGACLGARERARGKRKGRERQGRAGEREGRDVAGGGGCACTVRCHYSKVVMLKSVSNSHVPSYGRHNADYCDLDYVHIM